MQTDSTKPRRFRTHLAREQVAERYWERVIRYPDTECWGWNGGNSGFGYGVMTNENGRNIHAHRVSWRIHFGAIPAGLDVCHTCDNPPCSNPAHLFLGTHKENMLDCSAKKRSAAHRAGDGWRRGTDNGRAKLTDDLVRALRSGRKNGLTLKALAKHFGLGTTTVGHVIAGRTWSHVT